MDYKTILDKLYSDHYIRGLSSEAASSYWKKHGAGCLAFKKDNDYDLSGLGMRLSFLTRSPMNYIKCLHENLLAESLLAKYDCDKEIIKKGRLVAKKQNRIVDYDCVKHMLCANTLFRHGLLAGSGAIAVIGDGYGYMTSLLKALSPETTVISINLGRILMYDVFYTEKVFPQQKVLLADKREELENNRGYSIFFVQAEKYKILYSLPIDLFVNIASMQEMDMKVIRIYFDIIRSTTAGGYFYCCNRLEKKLPGGEVIRFFDYPWQDEDEIILDGFCPWYQKYPYRLPPFWRPFMGPIHHRLVKLKKTACLNL